MTRHGIALTIVAMCLPRSAAAQNEQAINTLKDVTGIHVIVEELKPSVQQIIHRATLQTDVELRLREEHIRVLTSDEYSRTPTRPFLYVRVGTVSATDPDLEGLIAYDVRVEFLQLVRLMSDPTLAVSARTWDSGGDIGLVGRDHAESYIRDRVHDEVAKFLNAFLSVNRATTSSGAVLSAQPARPFPDPSTRGKASAAAWLLWRKTETHRLRLQNDSPIDWLLDSAYASIGNCEGAAVGSAQGIFAAIQSLDGGQGLKLVTDTMLQLRLDDGFMTTQLLCFPDTVDPRK